MTVPLPKVSHHLLSKAKFQKWEREDRQRNMGTETCTVEKYLNLTGYKKQKSNMLMYINVLKILTFNLVPIFVVPPGTTEMK